MAKKEFNPSLKTPEADFCKEEVNKTNALNSFQGDLHRDFRDGERDDIAWESEAIAKSHGIYMEFDRGRDDRVKDWSYMVRVSVPGGGPIDPEAYALLDDISNKFTVGPRGNKGSLRFTTRQNVQFHWIKKENVVEVIRSIAESTIYRSLNGCGDNTRNVMACPASRFSKVFNGNEWARKTADYFELPFEPFIKVFEIDPNALREDENQARFKYGKRLLNRKFKIGFSSVYRDQDTGEIKPDNCVELRTNDLSAAPIFEGDKHVGFQLYLGGGQGERNGKPSIATLGKPLGIVTPDQLIPAFDAVVKVHQEWGDRKNRHWARVKYVVKKQGIDWFRDRVHEITDFKMEKGDESFDPGPRLLHHGWEKQETDGKYSFGMYLENGRLVDTDSNGRLKTAVRELLPKYNSQLMVTPNQDLIFNNIDESAKDDFQAELESYGYGRRNGKPYSALRLRSGACVGRDTCRLTYTDSEKFEPELLDELEEMGWGDVETSIGITGCERQCFRPSTKAIGLIGTGLDRYQLRLGGTEDAKHQGAPLYSEDKEEMFMRSIPRDKVAVVIDALLKNHKENAQDGEELGYFHLRVGIPEIIDYLKRCPETAELMEPSKVKAFLEA